MQTINFDKEYEFITKEFRREKPNPKNLFKREILLFLNAAIDKIKDKNDAFNIEIYKKTKKFYKTLK